MLDSIIIIYSVIFKLMDKLVGRAKFIINAGLKLLKEHSRNVAVLQVILFCLYVSADSFAPMGQPQKRPHIMIKGIYSLKFVLVNFLIIPRGFENAPMFSRIELIIVNGSNVGKTENNQRLSPIRA